MQLQSTQLTGLLGAIILSAGLASPVALADEPTEEVDSTVAPAVLVEESEESAEEKPELKHEADEMIEVRISMPDGRTIIRYEKARKSSARRSFPSSVGGSHILPDGSRISFGHVGVSGGSSSSSVGSSGSHSGGGSSGGASSGSSSSGSSSGGSSGKSASSSSGGVTLGEVAVESEGSDLRGAAGIFAGASASTISNSSTASTGSGSSSTPGSSAEASGSSVSHRAPRAVHTVGDARHSQEGAVGGQRVEFHDGGMGAAVIGNTVYFNGVQLVQANQVFEMVTGTRIGADTAMMQSGRLAPTGSGPLSTWNTGESAIKLDFESDTVVELVMFSEPENAITPDRIQRVWTVRIR